MLLSCRKLLRMSFGTLRYFDGYYHPEYICTRDQMAVYICRAFDFTM